MVNLNFENFVNDFINHNGSNVWVDWIKISYSTIDAKQKLMNVVISVKDEITWDNFNNIECSAKK